MDSTRILVIEDGERWREVLLDLLGHLGGDVIIDIAPDYTTALKQVTNIAYDLVTVDLALQNDHRTGQEADLLGMDLLQQLRHSNRNQGCGLIVLTGFGTTQRTLQAFREYDVDDFIDKSDFDDQGFIAAAQAAILNARLSAARRKLTQYYRLILTFNHEHLLNIELIGPDRRSMHVAQHRLNLRLVELTDHIDTFDPRLPTTLAQPSFHSIGKDLYNILSADEGFLNTLREAQALLPDPSDLWLQFDSPPIGLRIPFELLQQAHDYLSLKHIQSRRIVQSGMILSRKPEPFHSFIDDLYRRGSFLRILIVSANTDESLPIAEDEAKAIATSIGSNLQLLGMPHEITLLSNASYTRLSEALRDGHYHILHYVGPRGNATLTREGLILYENHIPRVLSAADVELLVRDSELRLVFLSCTCGPSREGEEGQIESVNILETIAFADVPIVIGYRWIVPDESAMHLALGFYQALWRTFQPGEALRQARRSQGLKTQSDTDMYWAAPILLMQNS